MLCFCLILDVALARGQPEAENEVEAYGPAQTSSPAISLRLEPGMAVALTSPQAGMTDTGFGQTIKLALGLTPFFELGPSATFTTLPASAAMADSGTSWSVGASARLMRSRDSAPGRRGFQAIMPWADADLLYVRTGSLDRPGFAVGAGLAIPLDQRRRLWLGPYVRYFQIVQGDRDGYDNRDAKLLTFGLSLEFASGQQDRRPVAMVAVASTEPSPPAPLADTNPDRDQDGVNNEVDRCADVAGPAEQFGCPPYQQVVVQPDKIEVKQKIAFEWGSSQLSAESQPALDEVVRALHDNPAFRVEVEGHASSDGAESYNQPLSEQRATAVLDYLIAHGVARDRLASRGFSSSVPLETNSTLAGRQANRRVEFNVHFIIVKPGQVDPGQPQGNTP